MRWAAVAKLAQPQGLLPGDVQQPAAERTGIAEAAEVLVGSDERVLHGVPGEIAIATKHAEGCRQHASFIPMHKLGVCGAVRRQHGIDKVAILASVHWLSDR